MTSTFTYGTARAVVMVGFVTSSSARTPQRIGPAHATVGRVAGGGKRALCGAFVSADEEMAWPPTLADGDHLCTDCTELAAL